MPMPSLMDSPHPAMPDSVSKSDLMRSLGKVVRGLSALFWGMPIALVTCVQTAVGDWFRPMGVVPALLSTGLLLYGLILLGEFQKQERIWHRALDRARLFAIVNVGLSPFLYWWSKIPSNLFFTVSVHVMALSGVLFLFMLNPVLWRLAAMLPDETLRHETRAFTSLSRVLLVGTFLMTGLFFLLVNTELNEVISPYLNFLKGRGGLWMILFLVLMPLAMTMALLWKIKEVILASVFSDEQ